MRGEAQGMWLVRGERLTRYNLPLLVTCQPRQSPGGDPGADAGTSDFPAAATQEQDTDAAPNVLEFEFKIEHVRPCQGFRGWPESRCEPASSW